MAQSVRDKQAASARERTLRGDAAFGAPGSADRQCQIWALYKLQLPDVFRHIQDPVAERATWLTWANGLAQGSLYAAHSLSAAALASGNINPLRSILRAFAPANAPDDSWTDDPVQRQEALDAKASRCGQTFQTII
ncbi:hypothetical protein BDZ88DRAFT_441764 [Geranomyces variabilis]|nr:hypothetical protein BDZ88DRAFT_441764 [Geranomyces variabilis]KAJ3131375.1 hypothetical protein HDU90_008312 [Geranomyces variabilis]